MNTYTFSISTTSPDNEKTYSEINLFDQTNFTIDMTDVYSDVFPNYIAFNWGDNSPIEEPDIKIFRDYKTESIYPEILNNASPVFLNTTYSHIYYPSDFALKKSMTLRINIGYITGALTKLTVPVTVRAESYYDTIGDMEITGIDLLNDENNSSRFTFLTKKDNHLIQTDNTTEKAEQIFTDRVPAAHATPTFFSPGRSRAKQGPRAARSSTGSGKFLSELFDPELKQWGEWGPPGKMDNIFASPFGFHPGVNVPKPWKGWSPWKVDQGVWDLPPKTLRENIEELRGRVKPQPKIDDERPVPEWALVGKKKINCPPFPKWAQEKFKRGAKKYNPQGMNETPVLGRRAMDWENPSESDLQTTYPPYYLYLESLYLQRPRKITYFQLLHCTKLATGSYPGQWPVDDMFEEGLGPQRKPPEGFFEE
jgi:hypothetical protein